MGGILHFTDRSRVMMRKHSLVQGEKKMVLKLCITKKCWNFTVWRDIPSRKTFPCVLHVLTLFFQLLALLSAFRRQNSSQILKASLHFLTGGKRPGFPPNQMLALLKALFQSVAVISSPLRGKHFKWPVTKINPGQGLLGFSTVTPSNSLHYVLFGAIMV